MKSKPKKAQAKTSVKFKDLKSTRDPKGGALNAYVKLSSQGTQTWIKGG